MIAEPGRFVTQGLLAPLSPGGTGLDKPGPGPYNRGKGGMTVLDQDDKAYIAQQISQQIKESESRMMAYFDAAILPKFSLLAEGIQDIQEKLVPRSRVDDLEEEVRFLKVLYRQMNDELQALKKAN